MTNDKCHKKKLLFFENPSAIKSMPDDVLVKAYEFAKQNGIKEDFVALFESELLDRGILE